MTESSFVYQNTKDILVILNCLNKSTDKFYLQC